MAERRREAFPSQNVKYVLMSLQGNALKQKPQLTSQSLSPATTTMFGYDNNLQYISVQQSSGRNSGDCLIPGPMHVKSSFPFSSSWHVSLSCVPFNETKQLNECFTSLLHSFMLETQKCGWISHLEYSSVNPVILLCKIILDLSWEENPFPDLLSRNLNFYCMFPHRKEIHTPFTLSV